jgi:hypothetical protein
VLAMRTYQQVIDVAEDTAAKLEELFGGPLDDAMGTVSSRGYWYRNATRDDEGAPNGRRLESW